METDFSYIDENYKRIIFNMQEAAAKYRKPDEKISLMAVTKTVDPAAINHAIGLGIKLLGENRVQEYTAKKDFYDKSAEVHFIGHLQTNKVKYIIDSVSMIQSVDSLHLAQAISNASMARGIKTDVLVEVNIGREPQKSGVLPEELPALLENLAPLAGISVRGMMTVPPILEKEYEKRKIFSEMYQLFIDNSTKKIDNIDMHILSMGMSGDYYEAILEGATVVRIGTAIFGHRHY